MSVTKQKAIHSALLVVLVSGLLSSCVVSGSNSSGGSGGCDKESSSDSPLASGTSVRCGDWTAKVVRSGLFPNEWADQGKEAISLYFGNRVPGDVPLIVVLEATYTGDGVGEPKDVFRSTIGGLISKNGTRYQVNYPIGAQLTWLLDVAAPVTGGTIRGALYFLIKPTDSELQLVLNLGPNRELGPWIDLGTLTPAFSTAAIERGNALDTRFNFQNPATEYVERILKEFILKK